MLHWRGAITGGIWHIATGHVYAEDTFVTTDINTGEVIVANTFKTRISKCNPLQSPGRLQSSTTIHPLRLAKNKKTLIFHRTDGSGKSVGGTPDLERQTISSAILPLGQYTLGEMDKIQALDSANLKPDSLTCQLWSSPPKATVLAHTTISFTLAP